MDMTMGRGFRRTTARRKTVKPQVKKGSEVKFEVMLCVCSKALCLSYSLLMYISTSLDARMLSKEEKE